MGFADCAFICRAFQELLALVALYDCSFFDSLSSSRSQSFGQSIPSVSEAQTQPKTLIMLQPPSTVYIFLYSFVVSQLLDRAANNTEQLVGRPRFLMGHGERLVESWEMSHVDLQAAAVSSVILGATSLVPCNKTNPQGMEVNAVVEVDLFVVRACVRDEDEDPDGHLPVGQWPPDVAANITRLDWTGLDWTP